MSSNLVRLLFEKRYYMFELAAGQLASVIENKRYGVEYQPLICIDSGDIVAYEGLARFYLSDGTTLPPNIVFNSLRNNLKHLRQVEHELKSIQIDFAPAGYDLFINLDRHAFAHIIDMDNDPLIKLLQSHRNLVVELIENMDIHDARASVALQEVLRARNIPTALDDIGASHSLISLEVLPLVNYLKFDLIWLTRLHRQEYQSLFAVLLEYAVQNNKPSILEGVESAEMAELARRYPVDYVQGFLYRDLFKAHRF